MVDCRNYIETATCEVLHTFLFSGSDCAMLPSTGHSIYSNLKYETVFHQFFFHFKYNAALKTMCYTFKLSITLHCIIIFTLVDSKWNHLKGHSLISCRGCCGIVNRVSLFIHINKSKQTEMLRAVFIIIMKVIFACV